MNDSEPSQSINYPVNADLYHDFVQAVEHHEGKKYGNMATALEDAMKLYIDFYGERNENTITHPEKESPAALVDQLKEMVAPSIEAAPERERRAVSNANPTEKRLRKIVADMPGETWVGTEIVETLIEKHAGSSFKTLKKYKNLLVKRGHIFEHPIDGTDTYATSSRTFTLLCENNPEVPASFIDEAAGRYEDELGEDWYLEALPNEFIQRNDLKYDEIDGLSSEAYRRKNDLGSEKRGFQ